MNKLSSLFMQALAWFFFAGVIGTFAQGPSFPPVKQGYAELKFSLAHLTERLSPCRTLTEEERQALPPTRRAMEVCERARAPAVVEVQLDDEVIFHETKKAAGFHEDGRVYMLGFWQLPVGSYDLRVAVRDTPRESGFDKTHTFRLDLHKGDSALLEVGDDGATLRQNR